MPHVQPLDTAHAPADARPLLRDIEETYGQVLNIFGTMAHQPDILKGVTAINDGLQKGLPPALRELAYVKASQLNGCNYCSHYHKMAAQKAGISDEQLTAIQDYANSDQFTDAEKHVLAYAEQLTKTGDVAADTVDAVKAHLSEPQLVTLAATVALANFTNRFNHGLGVELP